MTVFIGTIQKPAIGENEQQLCNGYGWVRAEVRKVQWGDEVWWRPCDGCVRCEVAE